MSLGELAIHIATLQGCATSTLKATEMDLSPPDGPGFVPPKFENSARSIETLDQNEVAIVQALKETSDEDFMTAWSLKKSGETLFTMPRAAVLRTFVMNHMIHHRGQLSVYLRLLDVPLPAMY